MEQATPATVSDLDAVCALVEAQQLRPERTIAYFSNEAGAIAEEITADDDWIERAWVVRSGGEVAGFLMADVDVELDRVWWMGPFAESESASSFDWSAIADRGAVAALHDQLFPGTHTTGRRLVDKSGDRFHCLVGAMAGRSAGPVVGYVAVEFQADGSGYIDFVGVDPDHRRSGLGRVLVAEATNTLFDLGATHVHLTVRESNVAARPLYASLGFTEDRLLLPYRKGFTLSDSS